MLRNAAKPVTISAMKIVALLLTREYTEIDARFMSMAVGELSYINQLRKARLTLLSSFLHGWEKQTSMRFMISNKSARSIIYTLLVLYPAIACYLESVMQSVSWTTHFDFFSFFTELERTRITLVSDLPS